jgi:hypothetical protein
MQEFLKYWAGERYKKRGEREIFLPLAFPVLDSFS